MMGKFITLEGCEGSGKSTQVKMLTKYLENNNIDYVLAREPGGTLVSESIRKIILDKSNTSETSECEALLYAAARVQLLSEVVMPALQQGKLVVLDRYIDSSFAYQAYARDLGFDFVSKINTFAIDNCMPDLTLFLNIDPESAFRRKGGADQNDRLELMGLDFHKKVYAGYLNLLEKYPNRIVSINGLNDEITTHNCIIKTLFDKGILVSK